MEVNGLMPQVFNTQEKNACFPFSKRLGGLGASLHVVRREKSLAIGGIQIPVYPPHTLIIIVTMLFLLLQIFGFYG
jgi:hypothetical protein